MKVKRTKPLPGGKREVVVVLEADETLHATRIAAHYRLARPVDEVVAAHIIDGMQEVTWCSASQAWVS